MTMMLCCIGCTESAVEDLHPQSLENENLNLRMLTEQYWVDPAGTIINAFDGSLILEFPEGVVSEPGLFTLTSFPLHRMEREGYHLMNRGFSIEPESDHTPMSTALKQHVKVTICFGSEFCAGTKNANESTITIFYVNDYGCESERIDLMCKCVRDASGNSCHGCIYCCGTYVIGES